MSRANGGAAFFVVDTDDPTKSPLFHGMFVGPRTALTINRHDVFKRVPVPNLHAVASNGRELEFNCVATDARLNFSVLRLADGEPDADAFFDLPAAHPSVSLGLIAGLVTIRHGASAHQHSMQRVAAVHEVTVSRDVVEKFYPLLADLILEVRDMRMQTAHNTANSAPVSGPAT